MLKIKIGSSLLALFMTTSLWSAPRVSKRALIEAKAKGMERIVLQNRLKEIENRSELSKEEIKELNEIKRRLGNTTADLHINSALSTQLLNSKNSIVRKGGTSEGFEGYLNRIIIKNNSKEETVSVYKILDYVRRNNSKSLRGEAITKMMANLMELYKNGGEMIAFSTAELLVDVVQNKSWKTDKVSKFSDILLEAVHLQNQNIKLTPHEAFVKVLENDPSNSFKRKIKEVLKKVCKG